MIEAALSMAKVQFAHNRWANELLLDSLKDLPQEQFRAAACSGNGSIGATAAHLVLVHQSWTAWLSGSATLQEAFSIVKKADELPDAESVRKRWSEVDESSTAYVDGLTEEAFVTERVFSLPNGTQSSLPLWQMLLQLTSHGVHTRGQIVSALRQVGVKPVEVSFIQFCMQTRQAAVAEDELETEAGA